MNAGRRAIGDILAFYVDSGVDIALGEEPVDRLREAEAETPPLRREEHAPRPAIPAPALPSTAAPTAAAEGAALSAAALARDAKTLADLRAHMEAFEGCALKATASRLVFADGNPEARLMLVGEAPGRDEDIQGLPFVGRSGQLLDRMLAAIGRNRANVYIANVIPWRPPGNRTPTPQETQVCLPFIRRQIELVDPDVLVCLGNPSSQALLGTREGIMRTRGKWFDYDTGTRTIRAMATFHPAYLLRQPAYKRQSWLDLLAISKALPVETAAD